MSHSEEIGELFRELEQSGSLESALEDGVRLACRVSGCPAGAIAADADSAGPGGYWLSHDPRRLLDAGGTGHQPVPAADARRGEAHIPLYCGGRSVGTLVLLVPRAANEDQLRKQVCGISSALAALLAAVESNAARPLSGVLSHQAFRARVVSELARSERCADELAVVHVALGGICASAAEAANGLWTRVAALGEALTVRLRKSDVVGLLGPDHLAVLLPGTSRLGARIAARRIELLARMPENDLASGSGRGVLSPECWLSVYPDDGGDVDSLCRFRRERAEAGEPVVATVPS